VVELGPEEVRRRIDRRRARSWGIQVLYRWESNGEATPIPEALEDVLDHRLISRSRLPYLRQLVAVLDQHRTDLDEQLQQALQNWTLDRLARIDRAILRLGAAEILYMDDIPPKATIQEAVQLAEQYGGKDSPRFVNGVLDALYKSSATGAPAAE
jgi:N utilization substance protein B